MSWRRAGGWLLLAGMVSVVTVSDGSEVRRVDRKALGSGTIDVYGKGVTVRVTDPLGRFTEWNGDSISYGIPECDAIGEEPIAEEDSPGDENPRTEFELDRLVPGEYRIEVRAREDVGAYLSVDRWPARFGEKDVRASADGRATLRKGQVAAWRLDWGCNEAADTCWAVLRQVKGPKTKVLVR